MIPEALRQAILRMCDALDSIGVVPEDQTIETGPLTAEELNRTEDD